MRALIVDDSRSMRSILRRQLESIGFECREAPDGQAGMEVLRNDEPLDLALVDWNMPVMNGLQMVQALRGMGRLDMKIMMVTTEGQDDFIVQALDAGADEYLMKPFEEEALIEKLSMLGFEDL